MKPKRFLFCWLFMLLVALGGLPSSVTAKTGGHVVESLVNEKWLGDFDGMVERRTIRVLVVPSKTFYFVDRGRQRGMTYDALVEFEKFVNRKLKTKTLKIHVVPIPVRRDKLMSGLESGLGDIAAANLTITDARKQVVDFSNPFGSGAKEVLVTGPSAPPISSTDDLAGKEIHVRFSSSYHESLVALNRQFEKSGRSPIRLTAASEVFEDEDLLELLQAGVIPMIVMDNHKAQFWQQIFDNIKVHGNIHVRSGGQIAWAFRKNSPRLKSIVNEFAKGHKKGTLMGNILLKRYLRDTRYIKNSLSAKELGKFETMVGLFKKFADEYRFDHLMIGAQAYQESGLDHSRRSSAGAIGVMQLLPSTAADPNVDIPDILKLDRNIHAGTKYMRFIIDRYFNDPAMDAVNQVLFGFAAYNAGPARVAKLRRKAAQAGFDPNRWFQNVEVIAAREIGRETVQYVSNIYKYYAAYSMVREQLVAKRDAGKSTKGAVKRPEKAAE